LPLDIQAVRNALFSGEAIDKNANRFCRQKDFLVEGTFCYLTRMGREAGYLSFSRADRACVGGICLQFCATVDRRLSRNQQYVE
jgi:hypothetical protein